MNKKPIILLLLLFLFYSSLFCYAEEYAPGELLVKFKPNVSIYQIDSVNLQIGTQIIKHFKEINVYHLRITVPNLCVKDAIKKYKESGVVEYAEPNHIWRIQLTPNDPSFSYLWGLHNTGQRILGQEGLPDADIDAPEAWDIFTGDPNIIIAVIDTGVDYTHPDLAANMWVNTREIPNNGIDDDNNGYVDDYYGWDFANDDNDPMDDVDHGSHCAGTIAGVGNNSLGIVGVNWRAKIMPLKFISAEGYGYTSDAIDAILYARMMGAKIMSNSWGGYGYSQALYDAIKLADASGILFVAAAGNDSNDNDGPWPTYPASYDLPNIIAVAATDNQDELAWFTNYGYRSVDLAAPGVNIYSTISGANNYAFFSGTSMACPHVSGVAALVWGKYPYLTHYQVKRQILQTVDKKPQFARKWVSEGRLNCYRALAGLAEDTTPPGYPPFVGGITDLQVTEVTRNSVTLTWTAIGDDGYLGRAAGYDIRYSFDSLNNYNWNYAAQVSNEPLPQPSGYKETFTITGLLPDTTYYIGIQVFDEKDNRSGIAQVKVQTRKSRIIFQGSVSTDDFEPQYPWGLEWTTSYDGTYKQLWTDSPYTNYLNNANVSLISRTIDLSGAKSCILKFYHRYFLEQYFDYAMVEVSTTNGASWSLPLASFTGTSPNWSQVKIDLSQYDNSSNFKMRFRIRSDDSFVDDGWYLDDIIIEATDTTPPISTLAKNTKFDLDISSWICQPFGKCEGMGVAYWMPEFENSFGLLKLTQQPGEKMAISQLLSVESGKWYTARAKISGRGQKVYLHLAEFKNGVIARNVASNIQPGNLLYGVWTSLEVSIYTESTQIGLSLISIVPSDGKTSELYIDSIEFVAEEPPIISSIVTETAGLTNPSFDLGTAGWKYLPFGTNKGMGTFEWASNCLEHNGVLKVIQNAEQKANIAQFISMTKNQSTLASVWLCSDVINKENSQKCILLLSAYDETTSKIIMNHYISISAGQLIPHQWTELKFAYPIRSDIVGISLIVINPNNNPSATLFLDDVRVTYLAN